MKRPFSLASRLLVGAVLLLTFFHWNTAEAQRRRSQRTCPDGCLCFITTVRCMHLGLDHIPSVASETRILDLRFNRIRNIPPSTFRGMRNLNTLLLNNNLIRSINEEAFQGLTSLKYLYLYKNRIQTIHKRAFKGLVSLEQLYLHDNEIRVLPPTLFSNLPKLERLFLHSNMITTLPSRLFARLTSLKRLRLDNNRLQCDCRLAWLSRMLSSLGNRIQAAAICHGPRQLAGRSVASIPVNDMVCDVSDLAQPIILVHPRDTDVLPGQSVRLLCRVRGSPQPQISWEHNGRIVNDDGRVRIMHDGTLFVQSSRQSDRGTYRCIAENSEGEAESNQAILRYRGSNGTPVFLVTPSSNEVMKNDRVTFHCRASGNPAPVTRWYRNDRRLPNSLNYVIMEGSLHIRSASIQDNGTFMCVAANSEGSINSTATLLVRSPPTFTITPEDQTVNQGGSVTLDCHAEGIPTPVITWLRNGEPLIQDQRYLVMSSGSLLIRAVNPEDEGSYTCKAQSGSGASVADAAVTVIIPPHFLVRPQNQRAPQGSTIDFQCRVAGRPPPQVVWTVHGRALPDDPRYNLLSSGTLRLLRIQPSDAGSFRCDGGNSVGSTHAEVTLTVLNQTPLSFVRTPTDQEVESGLNVRIACQVAGGASRRGSDIHWSKDGVRIVPSSGRYQVSRAPSSVLTIFTVGRDDSGRYQCTAQNGNEVITASMALVVRVKSSVSEIVEKLSSILPANCLRRGCTGELIEEEEIEVNENQSNLENVYEEFLTPNRRRTKRQSGSPSVVAFSELRNTVRTAEFEVDRGINGSIRYLNDIRNRQTSGDLLALMRFPSTREGIDLTRAAEVFDVTLRMIECCARRGMEFKKFKYLPTTPVEDFDTHPAPIRTDASVSSPESLPIIGAEVVELVANLSGCSSYRPPPDCSVNICFHRKYRTSDGTCNNLQHPMWGASLTPFYRVLQPIYENGFNSPVGWNAEKRYNNHSLPSARSVSVSVLMSAGSRPPREDPLFTHMVMQWGQFLDHDLDFTTMAPSIQRFSDGQACRDTCDNESPCFPITVDNRDPRHGRFHHHSPSSGRNRALRPGPGGCMEFTRSSAVCGSGITSIFFSAISRREQINEITSYLDASNVYSSTETGTRNLRDLSNENGLLKEGQSLEIGQLPLLPYNVYSDLDSDTPLIRQVAPIECRRGNSESAQQRGVPCFLAGDLRANEQVGLTSMHTLWMREHNRIARYLKQVNPHWDGDTIFHETRKIIGAQMQHITYSSFVPKLLGPFMERIGAYQGYNPNMPSSIVNVFATAAYRFGHTMINPIMYRLNASWHESSQGHLPLHHAFFAPFRIVHEGGIDPLIRGLIAKPMKARDSSSNMNQELIERLFSMAEEVALDLGALNIQRGRDHALPFYNEWREFCNLSRAETFDDLAAEIKNPEVREKLRQLYKVPSNIDPFVGMIVEDVVPKSRLGPTLGCILSEQFKRTRDGDRFWYEDPSTFSPAQLTSIKQASLARVICDNTDSIRTVPRDVFLNQPTSDFVSCDDVPSIDLSAWVDCCSDCSNSGSFETLSGHVRSQGRSKRSLAEPHFRKNHILSNDQNTTFSDSNTKKTKVPTKDINEKQENEENIHFYSNVQNESKTEKLTQDAMSDLLSIIKSLQGEVRHLQKEVHRLTHGVSKREK